MKGHSSKLRFGSSYCPYAKSGDVDMSVWERDFQTMRSLNFNAVRCFVAWDRIESEEGVFDFSKVDRIFELATNYGIDVILNVGGVFATYGGIYPPRWLIRDYKCQEIVKDPQHPSASFGPYKELCPDDELYRSKAESFTVGMVKRYSSQGRLFGWNVWNEAFLQPQCYCPLTLAKFREWLKAKYKDGLDELNKRWGSEFPVLYKSWEEVEPGLATGFLASGYLARLDWLRFNQERVASWVSGVNRIVKENDALKRPTSSNIVTTAAYGEVSWHGVPDLWSQSSSLDITGFSFYTDCGKPSHLDAGLASIRGSSNDPAKGFWVLETEAGQIANRSNSPTEVADGPRREATHWLSVMHGAKTSLVWKFGGRVTDNQTESFNLAAWDGSVTERAKLNAKVAKAFLANEGLFLERSWKSEVAILHSSGNALFSSVSNSFKDWQNARFGASRLMRDLRIPSDCIGDLQLLEPGALSNYKALLLPNAASLDQAAADAIARFVKGGGLVIADQRFGVFDGDSRNQLQAPGFGLKELFGSYVNDYLLGPASMELNLASGGSFKIDGNLRSILFPCGLHGAEVLGRYPDGSAAVSVKKAGAGAALRFGFQAFRDYEASPDAGFLSFMKGAFAERGIESDYEISGAPLSSELEAGALSGADGAKTHFLINLGPEPLSLSLNVKSAKGKALKEVLGGGSLDFSKGPAKVELSAWGVMILA